jgi:hypothetical protein
MRREDKKALLLILRSAKRVSKDGAEPSFSLRMPARPYSCRS